MVPNVFSVALACVCVLSLRSRGGETKRRTAKWFRSVRLTLDCLTWPSQVGKMTSIVLDNEKKD